MDPSSVMGHSNTANSFIVSRPEHVSQPHVPTHVVQVTVARPEPSPAPSNGQLSSAAPAAPTGGRANKAIVHQLQFSGERVDFQKIQFCQLRLSERLRAVLVGSAVLLSQAAAVLCSFEC